ncbi:extracellular solute-binding protein [Candidatus Poribacteria bacterium]|nr:extracellular solute-binding protein [Candidatus Poribacteria bacterium]
MKKYVLTILLSTLIGLLILAENTFAASEVVIVTSFPKELFEGYKKAFEAKYPEITVVVKSKKTSEAVAYVRETASKPDADIMWASAVDAFAVLKAAGLLAPHTLPKEIAKPIPAKMGPYPIHDPDGTYFGFALSGYGIMWNKLYLQAHKLKAPKEWTDLTEVIYYGHLAMSSPSRSGTTHLTVEAILQGYGWEKGWQIILNLSGNMAAITERSFGVPQGVINGEFGIGIVIDFFGLSAIASGQPVDFAYPSVTPIVPANVALIKGGPNPENAKKFIHYLLSEEGQLLLFDPQISRLPVIPELYTKAPKGFPNPFKMEASSSTFDVDLSEKRYGLMNSLFDQVVTFRLKELKEAWEAIYKTEAAIQKRKSRGKDVSKAAELLAEARTLVSTVPLSEEKANDATFNQNFKEEATDVQARYETEWDSTAKANYAKAKKLAIQAMDEVR